MMGRDAGEPLAVAPILFLKARPATEGDRRFVYAEASNESLDQQDEKVLKSALLSSRDLFLAKGNLDLDHMTILGHLVGVDNPRSYEIGRPVDVREGDHSVLVKGEVYTGEGKAAEKANWFWSTLTELQPPMPWYPSVGGTPLERRRVVDPIHKAHTVVTKTLWTNLAFSREPVNLSVPAASTVGWDAVTKALVLKTVTAGGYGTDVATYGGGAALRLQSHAGITTIDPSYDQAAALYLKAIRTGGCAHARAGSVQTIRDHFQHCAGMEPDAADAAATRFLGDVRRTLHDHRRAA